MNFPEGRVRSFRTASRPSRQRHARGNARKPAVEIVLDDISLSACEPHPGVLVGAAVESLPECRLQSCLGVGYGRSRAQAD